MKTVFVSKSNGNVTPTKRRLTVMQTATLTVSKLLMVKAVHIQKNAVTTLMNLFTCMNQTEAAPAI